MSNFVEKVKDKVEQVLHKDSHHSSTTGATTTGTHGHVGGASNTAGPHSSNVANEVDPRVDSDLDGSRNAGLASHGTGAYNTRSQAATGGTQTAGPHSSNLANKLDPRVDSDLDGSRNAGAASYGTGAQYTGTTTGSTGLTGGGAGFGGANDNAGPHSSNLANKLDPRVDSDMDGSRNAGMASYGAGAHNTATGAHHVHGNTAGPHGSDMANKLDPRVDSDMDGSRNAGLATHGPGAQNTGFNGGSHNTGFNGGAHNTGFNNGNRGDAFGGTTGIGAAPNTAGPHSSDLANKLDPRVDSDLDGSKTVGSQNY